MSDKRLIGEDASLCKFTVDTSATVSSFTAGTFYQIATIDDTLSIFGDLAVGQYYISPVDIEGGSTGTTTTDTAYAVTKSYVTDCISWSMALSSDEINTTVLLDKVKKYRKGMADVSGTIKGILTTEQIKTAGSITNRFFDVVVVASDGGVTYNSIDESDYYIIAYLNDDDVAGNTQAFILAQVELLGTNVGADMGSAQEWSSDIRITGDDPVMYTMDNPEA